VDSPLKHKFSVCVCVSVCKDLQGEGLVVQVVLGAG
jgi:hypothetical protein